MSPLIVIRPSVPWADSELNERKSDVSVSRSEENSTMHLCCDDTLCVELTDSVDAPAVDGLCRKVSIWSFVARAIAR